MKSKPYHDHFGHAVKKLLLVDSEHHVPFTHHPEVSDFAINAAEKRNQH